MFLVHLPELPRRAAPFRFEGAVEIREVVEAAFVTYLGDVPACIYQGAGGISQSYVHDIIRQCAPCPEPEETAECGRAHPYQGCHIGQPDDLAVVVVDVLFHLLHPAAFGVP